MVGIDVLYHCPECDCTRVTDLGCTPYIKYRGMKLAVLYCHHCGKKLACRTLDVEANDGFYEYKDDTGLRVLAKLEKHFNSKGYTEDISEEQIETEMWNYAVETFERVALVNEYEIKSFIQKLLSRMNRGSLFAITFDELRAESAQAGKCVYESAGAICW